MSEQEKRGWPIVGALFATMFLIWGPVNAGGVFFLCSPWSNYVQGQTLHITGGMFGGMTG